MELQFIQRVIELPLVITDATLFRNRRCHRRSMTSRILNTSQETTQMVNVYHLFKQEEIFVSNILTTLFSFKACLCCIEEINAAILQALNCKMADTGCSHCLLLG